MTWRLVLLAGLLGACACSSSDSGIGSPGDRPKCQSGADCTSGMCVDGPCVAVQDVVEASPLFEVGGPEVADV